MAVQPVAAPPIQVKGLEKSYKKLEVLRGVDFDVARGSIFALLGSNGAGKTTVVKILSTLLKADAGTASVNGFDVARQPTDVRESISLTGQFAAVDEILSGRENLVLVAQLRHLKDPGKIADHLLERFALSHQLGIRPDRHHARTRARIRREPAGDVHRRRDPRPVHTAAGWHRHLDRPCLVCRHPHRRVHLRHADLPPQDLLVEPRLGVPALPESGRTPALIRRSRRGPPNVDNRSRCRAVGGLGSMVSRQRLRCIASRGCRPVDAQANPAGRRWSDRGQRGLGLVEGRTRRLCSVVASGSVCWRTCSRPGGRIPALDKVTATREDELF